MLVIRPTGDVVLCCSDMYSDVVMRNICPQRGANRARNLGYTEAKGEYIQWLDADDELGRDKIERQVTALEQQPQFDIACSDWEWCFYDQGSCQWRLEFSGQCWTDPVQQHLLHHWHPPHAYLLRRAAADRLQAIQPGTRTRRSGLTGNTSPGRP